MDGLATLSQTDALQNVKMSSLFGKTVHADRPCPVQWLVFCDDGSRTAAAYAAKAGDATARNGVVGPDNFLTAAGLGNQGRLQRRQAFVLKMMYQIMQVRPCSF